MNKEKIILIIQLILLLLIIAMSIFLFKGRSELNINSIETKQELGQEQEIDNANSSLNTQEEIIDVDVFNLIPKDIFVFEENNYSNNYIYKNSSRFWDRSLVLDKANGVRRVVVESMVDSFEVDLEGYPYVVSFIPEDNQLYFQSVLDGGAGSSKCMKLNIDTLEFKKLDYYCKPFSYNEFNLLGLDGKMMVYFSSNEIYIIDIINNKKIHLLYANEGESFNVGGNSFYKWLDAETMQYPIYSVSDIYSDPKIKTIHIPSLEQLNFFQVKELVNEDLPKSIEFWTEAYCPNSIEEPQYNFQIPENYKMLNCEKGEKGSHGGCSTCVMSKITLENNEGYLEKRENVELDTDQLLHKIFPNHVFKEGVAIQNSDLYIDNVFRDYFIDKTEKSLFLVAKFHGLGHIGGFDNSYLGIFNKRGDLILKYDLGSSVTDMNFYDCDGVKYFAFKQTSCPNGSCCSDFVRIYKMRGNSLESVQDLSSFLEDNSISMRSKFLPNVMAAKGPDFFFHMYLKEKNIVIKKTPVSSKNGCDETDYLVLDWNGKVCKFEDIY